MGCKQSALDHEVQPSTFKPLVTVSGSFNNSFFTEDKGKFWKKNVETTPDLSLGVEIRNSKIMTLPNSHYLLQPLKIIRDCPLSIFINMEFAGPDLFEYMRQPFQWTLMQRHLQHIRSAIYFLHSHGIAHRDIKPENIIFHNGLPKFIDFDFATSLEEFRYCGTENYIIDDKVVNRWTCLDSIKSKRMDVYAFGKVVLSIFLAAVQFKKIKHKQFILNAFFNEKFLTNPYSDSWGQWAHLALTCCKCPPPPQIPMLLTIHDKNTNTDCTYDT